MNNHPNRITPFHYITSFALILLAGGTGYSIYLNQKNAERTARLSSDLYSLELSIASTTQILQSNIAATHSELSDALARQQQTVQTQIGTYQQQVNSVAGTVTTLQKLSQTDPELLQKYSKVFFLNENYAPAELTQIPDQYRYSETKQNLFATPAWPFLKNLLDAAAASNIKLYTYSTYRSFNEQSALKGDYKVTYGAGTANSFSADQGYSEHQLGTAVDFMTSGINGQLDTSLFEKTQAFQWLTANAYRYGFVLSYPKNNSYYIYEPWHWRFVGIKLATDLHNSGKNFADLDQRTIDTYLVNLYDPQ